MDNRNISRISDSHDSLFNYVISLENLFTAWREFKRGKTSKAEVQKFEFNLENNIFQLHHLLQMDGWNPEPYIPFYIRDPKLRHIHKATVRDRLFNQALFRVLYPIFDKSFIYDSYSCRVSKGTHRGVIRLNTFINSLTKNHSRAGYALKCDVKKFFDNISHEILYKIIERKITDQKVLLLIKKILSSFEVQSGKGLPLGNVTSQLFANVYLNELDQFIKHKIKAKYYLRYCDDFIILDNSKEKLLSYIPTISYFLGEQLKLTLHPNKIVLRKLNQGIDFLGYVILPQHRLLRTKTKNRIIKKIKYLKSEYRNKSISKERFLASLQSFSGILQHCEGYKIRKRIKKLL